MSLNISVGSPRAAKKFLIPGWILQAIGTVFIFSADQITRKIALGAIPPLWAASFAFSLASVSLWIKSLFSKTSLFPVSYQYWKKHVISGFLYALVSFLSLYGLKFSFAARSSILFFSYPFFVCLFGALGPRAESISIKQCQGMALAALGIIFVVARGSNSLLADCLILISAMVMGYLLVHVRDLSRETSTEQSIFWQLTLCVPFCLMGALLIEDAGNINFNRASIQAILYQGIMVNCVGVFMRGELIRRKNAGTISSFFFLTPFLTLILGFFVLNEAISLNLITGALIVTSGVIWINKKQ